MRLESKVAIVTGSSRGIGRNIALELAREGADIVVAARSEEVRDPKLPGTIYATAQEIRALGRRALPVPTDVTSEDSVEAMVRSALQEFGRVDILVNNAGIMVPGTLVETPLRRWDLVLRVNLRGAVACCRAVLPHMMERREGVIINISSVAAERPGAGNISYSVTKQAMRKLTEGLAEEVREYNIRVFSLSPEGLVITPGTMYYRLPGQVPSGPYVEPPEVMGRAAVLLCVEATAELSGRHFYSRALLRERAPPVKDDPGGGEGPASDASEEPPTSRSERRERRRRAARARMPKHGASLRRVYRDAVEKRARKRKSEGEA